MMKGGQVVGDGSWTLAVFVTDLQVERRLRVHGGLHIGGVMIKLVDELGRKKTKKLCIFKMFNNENQTTQIECIFVFLSYIINVNYLTCRQIWGLIDEIMKQENQVKQMS